MLKEKEIDVLTQDFLKILNSAPNEEDCLSNVYGLWESLSVDMLSPSETKRLAEHLDVCEKCRNLCADLHKMCCDDELPFNERMRAFRENPDAETDFYWRRIASAFDPTLGAEREYEAMVEARILVDVRRFKAKNEEEAKVKALENLERFLIELQNDRDFAPDAIAYIEAFDCGQVLEIEEVGEEEE